MLTQLDLYFRRTNLSGLYSDLGVKIHGFLMSRIPTELAEEFHNGALQPFSLYCVYGEDYGILRVSALTERAIPLLEELERCRYIPLMRDDRPVRLELFRKEPTPLVTLADLSAILADKKRISVRFMTPAMYRSAGVLRHDPNLPAYFESVIQKLAQFEGLYYTRDAVDEAFRAAMFGRYSLSSEPFISGKKRFTGMAGNVDLTLPEGPAQQSMLRTLLAYATYAGVGGMTTQGMGGVVIE